MSPRPRPHAPRSKRPSHLPPPPHPRAPRPTPPPPPPPGPARPALDQLLGTRATSNLLFVETNEGVNNDVLAAGVDGTHLANGAYARSFERLARESVSTRRQFLDVSAGYAAIGLVAALAGIAIVMIDRVRERRRQFSTLRAFGCRAATVSRSCRVETAVIALEAATIRCA